MKTLIIYAHPETKGHNYAILEETKKWLENNKQDYEVLDLYKMKFDPVLKEEEHYSFGKRDIKKEVKQIQDNISKTKKMIFIFPIWWNNVPAILKGFLDRVFTTRFAFNYKVGPLNMTIPEPLLKGKKAVAIYTSGSPRVIYSLIFGRRGYKVIAKDSLRFCGIKTKGFHLGSCGHRYTKEKLPKVKRLVNSAMNWLAK